MNEYIVDKLVNLNVTKCPYFEYWQGGSEYFGACLQTNGSCDNQPKCQWKNARKDNR